MENDNRKVIYNMKNENRKLLYNMYNLNKYYTNMSS